MRSDWSPAALFLMAAKAARGSSLGDREYSKMMHDMIGTAIDYRMKFDHNELLELSHRLDFFTSVGVFRTISEGYYTHACWNESSYATAYQVATDLAPWKCPKVFRPTDRYSGVEGIPGLTPAYREKRISGGGNTAIRVATKSCKPKVASGIFVELPGEETLFRCTAVASDKIRFVPDQPDKSARKRLVFTRDQWVEMFP